MKKSLVLASLLAIGTSAFAVDGFIGAGVGGSWGKYKYKGSASISGYSESYSDKGWEGAPTLSIKGGVILDDSHRLSLAYIPAFYDDATVHNFLAAYDYLISVNDKSRFYLGAHAGVAAFRGKDGLVDGENMSGFAYGTQFGYIFDVNKNVEFEVGAMYTKHTADKKESASFSHLNYNVRGDAKFEAEHTISVLMGFNYKF